MTPAAFNAWLAAMKTAGLARFDADCAKLLGVSNNSIVKMKRDGANRRTALACAALYNELAPWPDCWKP